MVRFLFCIHSCKDAKKIIYIYIYNTNVLIVKFFDFEKKIIIYEFLYYIPVRRCANT